jgi:protein PsiE
MTIEREGGKNPLMLRAVRLVESLGLVLILLATLVAVGEEVWLILTGAGGHGDPATHVGQTHRYITLADLLLFFIYLEVIAMVGIYFESHRLPVRFVLYIAMMALARHIILDMKHMEPWTLVGSAGAIVLVALAILVVRFGHTRYPYGEGS